MFKVIAGIIIVLVIAVLGFAATKPDTFRYERSTVINAKPETIFAILNDFHKQSSWSPFEKKDPGMKRAFSGSETGKGSVYEWDGNAEIGQGRLEIIESIPSSKIVTKLDFIKPFKATNTGEFVLEPQGDATKVTWAMYGPVPFVGKIINVFIDCEKMVGKDFEQGLADLKAVTEK